MSEPNYDIIIDKEHNRPLHCPDLVSYLRSELAEEGLDYDAYDLRSQIAEQVYHCASMPHTAMEEWIAGIEKKIDRIYAQVSQ